MNETAWITRLLRRVFVSSVVLVSALSCESERHEPTGGETHFLKRCDPNAADCGRGLSCLCGVCTLRCEGDVACSGFDNAECISPSDSAVCGDSDPGRQCDVRCTTDAECKVLSASHRCDAGACRAGAPITNGGAGGASGAGGSGGVPAGAGGQGGSSACVDDGVAANEVLVIGDAFLAASHQITAYLEDFARGAGALASGQRYRDNSTIAVNALALGGNGIANQYDSGVAEGTVKVVIMNGGGADVLLGSCETADSSCAVLTNAAAGAATLLARMASDGVTHVVYAFYPDPVDAVVREKMDALRPLIQDVCSASTVPCHWLDLRTAFAGNYSEYIQGDGLNPTSAGAQASAAAIWSVMQEHCVAQ